MVAPQTEATTGTGGDLPQEDVHLQEEDPGHRQLADATAGQAPVHLAKFSIFNIFYVIR